MSTGEVLALEISRQIATYAGLYLIVAALLILGLTAFFRFTMLKRIKKLEAHYRMESFKADNVSWFRKKAAFVHRWLAGT